MPQRNPELVEGLPADKKHPFHPTTLNGSHKNNPFNTTLFNYTDEEPYLLPTLNLVENFYVKYKKKI